MNNFDPQQTCLVPRICSRQKLRRVRIRKFAGRGGGGFVPIGEELLAVGERAAEILLADGLAGEVERTLADGGVAVEIRGAVGRAEAFHEVAPPARP